MSAKQRFDFSSRSIPSTWHEAANDGLDANGRALDREKVLSHVPDRRSFDMFAGCLAALVVCIGGVYGWYELEVSSGQPHSWVAVPLGAAIALAFRFAGGEPDHQVRAVLSFIFYAGSTLFTLFLIGRAGGGSFYGRSDSLGDFEQQLINGRFADTWAVVSVVAGAIAAVYVSYALRLRPRRR